MGTKNNKENTSVDRLMAEALGEKLPTVNVSMKDAALILRTALTKAADVGTSVEESKGIIRRCHAFTGAILEAPTVVTKGASGDESVCFSIEKSLATNIREDCDGVTEQQSWDNSIAVLRNRITPTSSTSTDSTVTKKEETQPETNEATTEVENWEWCRANDVNYKPLENENWGDDPA